jgi:hypothetical protein
MIKPGYRTSEFWFTLVSFIFSGLYLTGIINDHTNKDELISVVSHAVESCILIGGQFVILYKYINSRKNVKTETTTPEPINNTENDVVVDNKEEKKDEPKPVRKRKSTSSKNKPRTNTKRSRKPNK